VKRLLPWLVAVAFFMESLDTTILNTAVPAIAKALAVAPLISCAGYTPWPPRNGRFIFYFMGRLGTKCCRLPVKMKR
jgi:MFS family permease